MSLRAIIQPSENERAAEVSRSGMRAILSSLVAAGLLSVAVASAGDSVPRISLPKPRVAGDVSVEEALRKRRSVREYSRRELDLAEIAQLLWSAQGRTSRHDRRTAPSAGGLYPLELYVVAGNVDGLSPGIYRYRSRSHELELVAGGDRRTTLAAAALDQNWVRRAPAALVVAAVYERTEKKYGKRGRRYVHMEVGSAAENVYLQAEASGLAMVFVGAFDDAAVQRALGLPEDHEPLGIIPVGHKR